jgi:DHA3 family tetracycline resistance protein-like MFS transporter
MQRVVPTELLGRVKSLDWLISIGFVPASFAVTGPVAAWLGVKTVLLGAGISASLLTLLFYFLPGMRDTELPGHRDRVVLSEPPPEAPEIRRTEPAEVR